MSDSSDEDVPFSLRDYSEESDEEGRPSKRRRTQRQPALRSKGLGFVSAGAQVREVSDEEDDIDDERPSMGLGAGGMEGLKTIFGIGQYNGEIQTKSPSPDMDLDDEQAKTSGRGPSAFGAGGKIQKNSFAARMMAKQGYVEGQGLGKSGQGITAPIQQQLLQSRAGLGHGSAPEKPAKKSKARPKQDQGRISGASTPGTGTPRIKQPPRKKYEVAAIESRGLFVPDALKSIIVDATGAEPKTLTSLSGLSTPTTGTPPAPSEATKASMRVKMQLQAYADAWDVTREQEARLDDEDAQVQTTIELHDTEEQKFQNIIADFERVTMDDSRQNRDWDQVVQRLQDIQDTFADYMEDLDLPELAASCLEAPLRREISEWDPLAEPTRMVSSLRSIGALLELEKSARSRHRKRATLFEALLYTHWIPPIRHALREWSVYDPEKALSLIETWANLVPPWILYKVLNDIVVPKLMEAVRRFPKSVDHTAAAGSITNGSSSSQNRRAPALHSWLFEWWTMLSSPDLDLEHFPTLRSLVKSKVDSESWPLWKPLLGSRRSEAIKAAKAVSTPSSLPTTPAAPIEELSFKDILADWCAENDLVLRSSQKSDASGRLLYRLHDASGRGKGILVYLADDIVFGNDGTPFALGDDLIRAARGT